MGSTERVTIRLSPETMDLLQTLVDDGQFHSLSDAVACAVDEFIGSRITPERISEVVSAPPCRNVIEMEALVHDGSALMMGDAVRDAVREYVRTRRG